MLIPDLIAQQALDKQYFQGTMAPVVGTRCMLYNPLNSGVNAVLSSYLVTNSSTQPISLSNETAASGGSPFTYFPGSNGQVPGTTGSMGTNTITGVAGKLRRNTDAAFDPTGGAKLKYGKDLMDLQANSSLNLRDINDLAYSPVVLYPGDAFGWFATTPNTNFSVQVFWAELSI